jgi:hypothetical protein
MIAVFLVRAFPEEEMVIAELQLLQTIEFIARNALEVETIHSLSIFIPLHSFGRGG